MLVVGLGKVFQVGGVGATSTSVVVGVVDVNLKFRFFNLYSIFF